MSPKINKIVNICTGEDIPFDKKSVYSSETFSMRDAGIYIASGKKKIKLKKRRGEEIDVLLISFAPPNMLGGSRSSILNLERRINETRGYRAAIKYVGTYPELNGCPFCTQGEVHPNELVDTFKRYDAVIFTDCIFWTKSKISKSPYRSDSFNRSCLNFYEYLLECVSKANIPFVWGFIDERVLVVAQDAINLLNSHHLCVGMFVIDNQFLQYINVPQNINTYEWPGFPIPQYSKKDFKYAYADMQKEKTVTSISRVTGIKHIDRLVKLSKNITAQSNLSVQVYGPVASQMVNKYPFYGNLTVGLRNNCWFYGGSRQPEVVPALLSSSLYSYSFGTYKNPNYNTLGEFFQLKRLEINAAEAVLNGCILIVSDEMVPSKFKKYTLSCSVNNMSSIPSILKQNRGNESMLAIDAYAAYMDIYEASITGEISRLLEDISNAIN